MLQRVQAGDIELDDTIAERLPELTAAHPEVGAITVQQLRRRGIGHTGQILGWEALVLYDTDTGETAAVMVNANGVIGDVAAELDTVFPALKRRFG